MVGLKNSPFTLKVKIKIKNNKNYIMSISDLHLFSAGSENDGAYQNLWIKGASLFIPQINK